MTLHLHKEFAYYWSTMYAWQNFCLSEAQQVINSVNYW